MNRRTLLALLPILALPGAARAEVIALTDRDRTDLARIQAYLNSVHSLKAQFLQVAANGSVARGTAWLDRPGRMRFQYDPPSPLLLVAGHGLVVFHDAQLNQTSNIPLSRTPLGILLADQVRLSGPVKVTGMQRLPGMISVTLVRPSTIADGSLTLVFADNPLTLRQWTVLDAQHQETRVTLYDVQLGGHFKDTLFDFIDRGFPNGTPLAPSGGG